MKRSVISKVALMDKSLLGLPEDKDSAAFQVYLDLAQAILASTRESTLIQELMQLDELADESAVNKRITQLNTRIANKIGALYNKSIQGVSYLVARNNAILDPDNPQAHLTRLASEGLKALSPIQAQRILNALENEQAAKEVEFELRKITEEKIKVAIQSKNLAAYMTWWTFSKYFNLNYVETTMEYCKATDVDGLIEEIVAEREEIIKKLDPEVKIIERLKAIIDKIPEDPTKPRIAMVRMPKEIDPSRPVRVMIDFPPNTYRPQGLKYFDLKTSSHLQADPNRRIFYSGKGAPACMADAYNQLYLLTRKKLPSKTEKEDQYKPRPFYVASYVAENADQIPNFPANAKQFLEISFADNSPPIAPTRTEIAASHPSVKYVQKPAIERSDLESIKIDQDGLAHFILGYDEHGRPIKQDTVQYAMEGLLSIFSNVDCISIEEFLL